MDGRAEVAYFNVLSCNYFGVTEVNWKKHDSV